jgi:rare lipoprotein A
LILTGIGLLILPFDIGGAPLGATPAMAVEAPAGADAAAPHAKAGEASREATADEAAVRAAIARRAARKREIVLDKDPHPNHDVVKVIRTRATWYGPGFHGKRTASGERFNRDAMTLASRHLPLGTKVRVINPSTGKSSLARVNDRGPFGSRHVTVDLSQGLAKRIGLRGTGPVHVEVLKPKKKAKPLP